MGRPRRSRDTTSAPLVTAALTLANVAAYAFERASVAGGGDPCTTYGVVPAHLTASSMLTYGFLHDPTTPWHLVGNLVALVAFGTLVERKLGSLRFVLIYFAAGLGGALTHVLIDPSATDALVGASGCIFGLLSAAAMLFPRLVGFVCTYAAIEIGCVLTGTNGSVSAGCHIGGFSLVALGFVAVFLVRHVRRDHQHVLLRA